MNVNANLNNSECTQRQLNIGDTVYTNICSGDVSTIYWGTADWAAFMLIAVIVTAVFSVFLGLFLGIIRDKF